MSTKPPTSLQQTIPYAGHVSLGEFTLYFGELPVHPPVIKHDHKDSIIYIDCVYFHVFTKQIVFFSRLLGQLMFPSLKATVAQPGFPMTPAPEMTVMSADTILVVSLARGTQRDGPDCCGDYFFVGVHRNFTLQKMGSSLRPGRGQLQLEFMAMKALDISNPLGETRQN